MGRKIKSPGYDKTQFRLMPFGQSSYEKELEEEELEGLEEAEKDKDEGEGGEEGQAGGSGGGGGPHFDETEHDFDPTELQGLSLPTLRAGVKKGLKLFSRLTKKTEHVVRNLLPDISLRARVLELAYSQKGHPTLLLDKGEIVQYQFEGTRLERVRVSPDLEAERAVKYAMAGFAAAGESIDPKHVKFGRSPEFAARMKPIWEREWQKLQSSDGGETLRKDVKFTDTVAPVKPQPKSAPAPAKAQAKEQAINGPRIDLRRVPMPSRREPHI